MESETPVIGKPASIKLNFRQTKGFPALLIALGIVMTYFMMCILGGAIDNDVLIFFAVGNTDDAGHRICLAARGLTG